MQKENNEKVTIEVLLRRKLLVLFDSMNERSEELFDENFEILEMLLSYDEKAHKELIEYQNKLKKILVDNIQRLKKDSVMSRNTIVRKRLIRDNKYKYEWLFRKDCMYKVIEIFRKRGILESEISPEYTITKG